MHCSMQRRPACATRSSRIRTVDGVLEVERVRFRKAGNRYFATFRWLLERNFTFQRSEQVSDAVTSRVRRGSSRC